MDSEICQEGDGGVRGANIVMEWWLADTAVLSVYHWVIIPLNQYRQNFYMKSQACV